MHQIGRALDLDVSHLGGADTRGGERDRVQVIPEEVSTEDLMRIWDGLPGDYRLSAPYLVKTLRPEPVVTVTQGTPARTVALPVEAR